MPRVSSIILGVLTLLATACQPALPASPAADTAADQELVVFAAASLTDAFTELGATFSEAHPGTRVTFNFAGSQQLAQQLTSGAPADLFAPANQRQMQVAADGGRIAAGAPQPFVRNRLVVITPRDNPATITTLDDLAQPGIKLVLADTAVPVGQYSLEFLAKASAQPDFTAAYSPTVLANVVSYENNVRSVLTKVQLGEADAGIVYTSDITGEARDEVQRLDIPDDLNVIATYPIAVVGDSAHAALAAQFVELVLSPEGQQVLASYGFIPVGSE